MEYIVTRLRETMRFDSSTQSQIETDSSNKSNNTKSTFITSNNSSTVNESSKSEKTEEIKTNTSRM